MPWRAVDDRAEKYTAQNKKRSIEGIADKKGSAQPKIAWKSRKVLNREEKQLVRLAKQSSYKSFVLVSHRRSKPLNNMNRPWVMGLTLVI